MSNYNKFIYQQFWPLDSSVVLYLTLNIGMLCPWDVRLRLGHNDSLSDPNIFMI